MNRCDTSNPTHDFLKSLESSLIMAFLHQIVLLHAKSAYPTLTVDQPHKDLECLFRGAMTVSGCDPHGI